MIKTVIDFLVTNEISIDQILNLIASSALFGLAVLSIYKSRRGRLSAIIISVIALFNVFFYYLAITTNLNETYRFEYASISGIRSFVTILVLCGVCIQYFRDRL